MDKDILKLYQLFLSKLKHAKEEPTALSIFESVAAYDELDQRLSGQVRTRVSNLLDRQLPGEWLLWRRCAENFHRLPAFY